MQGVLSRMTMQILHVKKEHEKLEILQVMDVKKGHEELKYDPSDPADVRRIMDFIREKQDKGFYLYGYMKDGNYKAIKKIKDIDNTELREFILTKEMKKKIISLPVTGG